VDYSENHNSDRLVQPCGPPQAHATASAIASITPPGRTKAASHISRSFHQRTVRCSSLLDNVRLARILLRHGAKLVEFDDDGKSDYSAIHAARSAEMVEVLIENHADPNQTVETQTWLTYPSFTPLHYYAILGNLGAMRVALENRAELHPSGPRVTPLHVAAEHNIDSVRFLLEHGADPLAISDKFTVPLHLAAGAGLVEVVKVLVDHSPEGLWQNDFLQYVPLHMAAVHGRVDIARILVERWPTGKISRTVEGMTPLRLFERTNKRYNIRYDFATVEEMRAVLAP
jgi:ankyrin repeat protein